MPPGGEPGKGISTMAMTEEERRTFGADGHLDAPGGTLAATGDAAATKDERDAYLDEPMTLQEHLKELRDRIIKAGIGVVIGMIGGFFVAGQVMQYFRDLIKRADPNARFIQTGPTEYIIVFFKIAFYFGIALAMPIIIYQFIRFLAPGLTKQEKRYVYLSMPFIMFFFVLGVAFATLVAIPNMFHFLLTFSAGYVDNDIRVSETLDFFGSLSLWTGIIFELPVVMFLLAALNIAPYRILRKTRKYASVGLMILAAVITPTPDPINMLLVWAPMYLLFELGLFASRFARPRREVGSEK